MPDDTHTEEPAPERTPRVVLLVPLVVLGALPLILLKFGTGPITDPDALWHIVAGRDLWSTWQFAGPDQLAEFTRLPFVYHQWLPELLMDRDPQRAERAMVAMMRMKKLDIAALERAAAG